MVDLPAPGGPDKKRILPWFSGWGVNPGGMIVSSWSLESKISCFFSGDIHLHVSVRHFEINAKIIEIIN